jgi:hypothetical protein
VLCCDAQAGLLAAEPAALGWSLPTAVFDREPAQATALLGRGAHAVAYQALWRGRAVVLKHFSQSSKSRAEFDVLARLKRCPLPADAAFAVPALAHDALSTDGLSIIYTPIGAPFALAPAHATAAVARSANPFGASAADTKGDAKAVAGAADRAVYPIAPVPVRLRAVHVTAAVDCLQFLHDKRTGPGLVHWDISPGNFFDLITSSRAAAADAKGPVPLPPTPPHLLLR